MADCLAGYRLSVITKRDDASRGLTREELLALPAAVDLETANRALSLRACRVADHARSVTVATCPPGMATTPE